MARQKQYGDVVTFVRNGDEMNALVLQSTLVAAPAGAVTAPDEEHLVLTYLDPVAKAVVIQQISRAVATAHGVRHVGVTGGMGWKEFAPEAVLETDESRIERDHELIAEADDLLNLHPQHEAELETKLTAEDAKATADAEANAAAKTPAVPAVPPVEEPAPVPAAVAKAVTR